MLVSCSYTCYWHRVSFFLAMWPRKANHWKQVPSAGVTTGATEGLHLLPAYLGIIYTLRIVLSCVGLTTLGIFDHRACGIVWMTFCSKTVLYVFYSVGSDISHSRWRDLRWRRFCLLFRDVAAYSSGEPVENNPFNDKPFVICGFHTITMFVLAETACLVFGRQSATIFAIFVSMQMRAAS